MFFFLTLWFQQSIFGRRFRKRKYSHNFGADTILRASENCTSGLHFPQCSWKAAVMQLDKRWRVIASAAAWRSVNTTLSGSLSPLNLPFHTLLPSQDAGPDGPAADCSPSGSCWQQGPLGPLPLPSFQSLNMGSESVLAFRLNATAQEPIWQRRCTVTA